MAGVWGLTWGKKQAWASALQSMLWESRLGRLWARNKQRTSEPVPQASGSLRTPHTPASLPSLDRPHSDNDADAEAEGDVSESETLRMWNRTHNPPPSNADASRSRARSIRSVGERMHKRVHNLVATMGAHLQRKGRHSKSQRATKVPRSNMILLPGGSIRRAWDCFGLFLMLLLIIVQVANERWKSQHKGWIFFDVEQPYNSVMLQLQVLQDVFFIIDIFVNFRTSYVDEATGRYVKDAWRIASHYSRHWLLLDLFCAIPLDMILSDTPDLAVQTQRRRGPKHWLKWLLRKTGVLHVLRRAGATRPLRGARHVGKMFVHGRRVLRMFGGVSQTLRSVNTLRQMLSLSSALMISKWLRDLGVFRVFSNASGAARTLAGSFAFLRLLVSMIVRGWDESLNAVGAAASHVYTLLRGKGEGNSEVKAVEDQARNTSPKPRTKVYEHRGRNPLATPLRRLTEKTLLLSASKSTSKKAEVEMGTAGRGARARAKRLVYDGQDSHDGAAGRGGGLRGLDLALSPAQEGPGDVAAVASPRLAEHTGSDCSEMSGGSTVPTMSVTAASNGSPSDSESLSWLSAASCKRLEQGDLSERGAGLWEIMPAGLTTSVSKEAAKPLPLGSRGNGQGGHRSGQDIQELWFCDVVHDGNLVGPHRVLVC